MLSQTMRCPTCRAEQVWSDTCRRCKSDLRLLRDVAEDFTLRTTECLRLLHQNKVGSALEQARHCCELRDDAKSRQLLAVCELLNSHFHEAAQLARDLIDSNHLSTPD